MWRGFTRNFSRERASSPTPLLPSLPRALAAGVGGFGPHQRGGGGRRPDEDEPGVHHALRELGVLGQEAVAWVDGVGAALLGGVDQLLHVEGALARRRRADVVRLGGVARGRRRAADRGE